MKVMLLVLFFINGVQEGPFQWLDKDTLKPVEFANEEACDALVTEYADGWIAHEKADHQTDDVKLQWACPLIGQDA